MADKLLFDRDWSRIDGKICRVVNFKPAARVENGQITDSAAGLPYGAIELECEGLLPGTLGAVRHKQDFINLWTVFSHMGSNDEALIIWTKTHYKWFAAPFAPFLPRMWVMGCYKGSYELWTDPDCKLGDRPVEMYVPIVDWKPSVMK